MRPQIPVPSKGQPLRATWGTQVANRVNELCAMAPAGALHREGFGGIGDQALPQNLRDRRASAGRPMPFDLKAEIETNQAGTQQRLVVKWYYGGNPAAPGSARVWWNYWTLTPPTLNTPTIDAAGWVTVYTGSWASIGDLSDSATIELWYELQVMPSWQGTPSFQVRGSWYVQESSDSDYSDCELNPLGVSQDVVSYIVLGKVSATSGGIRVFQAFHGDLRLNDLLTLGEGGGGGGDATNGTTYPMPFQYKRTDTEDSQGNVTSSYAIVNNRFYWDGEYHTLADYVPPATGTVYLQVTKSGTGAGSWSFSLVTTAVANPTPTNMTIQLYEFSASRIVMDYRTTTLMFGPGPRDYFKVEKPDGTIKAELDATGTDAKATFEGATHDVIIDAADATQGDVELRECDYYAPGTTTPEKVNILASKALTIGPPTVARTFLTGLAFRIENGYLKVKVYKRNIVTDATSNEDVNICAVRDLDVVTNTDYTNPNFTQLKQSVTVIGEAPSTSPTPTNVFTSTPLTAEMTGGSS